MAVRYGSGRMSARAAKTCASLMKVGPSSASVRVSRSARTAVPLGVAAPGPADDEKPPPVAQERQDERQQPAEDDQRAHLARRQSSSHPARPSSRRNPQTSVKVVTKIEEAMAGIDAEALEQHGNESAGEPGHEQVARHREKDHQPEPRLVADQRRHQPDDAADGEPVHHPDQHFLADDPREQVRSGSARARAGAP